LADVLIILELTDVLSIGQGEGALAIEAVIFELTNVLEFLGKGESAPAVPFAIHRDVGIVRLELVDPTLAKRVNEVNRKKR
tara:strand:- start:291 stop:533 length:243 start_codon:yes stop_codon:yes gene_type:complete